MSLFIRERALLKETNRKQSRVLGCVRDLERDNAIKPRRVAKLQKKRENNRGLYVRGGIRVIARFASFEIDE